MDVNRIKEEISAYNDIARTTRRSDIQPTLDRLIGVDLMGRFRAGTVVEGFPEPPSVWLDSRANPVSQREVYRWLAPIEGMSFLQLGGSGPHAIKAIIGGAGAALLLTPVVGEATLARRMAETLGVSDRLEVVLGIGEQLPFADGSIDAIFGGGTLHHIQLSYGMAELARVLKPGGRAAFYDPNLNFIYRILEFTRIRNLARESGAQCYPLNVPDVYDNAVGFRTVNCVLSGGPMRYAIVGLTRVLNVRFPLMLSLMLQSFETNILRGLRLHRMLGSLAVLLEK